VDSDLASEGDPALDVVRFERPTRIVHWVLAAPFVLLLLTGLTNFVPRLKATQFADERLFAWAHVILGFASVAAVVLVVLPQLGSRAARADLRAITRLSVRDYLWVQHAVLMLTAQPSRPPAVGKFNAGQKGNALLSFGATAALLGTGLILGVNYISKRVFTAEFVESVFPLHTWVALLFIPVLLGHLYLALVNPSTRESLRAITRGRVRRDWAAHHHDGWIAEVDTGLEAVPPAEHSPR
jgi:formate dehydrogenase gamma subunit